MAQVLLHDLAQHLGLGIVDDHAGTLEVALLVVGKLPADSSPSLVYSLE
jgi:hypothetical protein